MRKTITTLLIALLSTFSVSAQEIDTTATDQSLLQTVIGWYEQNMNYGSITALMAVESSFVPFPSEVVIPPAAYVASDPENSMNVPLVVLFGTLGALIGAIINYLLALWLGRPIIYKFADSKIGHLLLLSGEKVAKAETYFNEHGKISTFVGRLIPGIRQLISIPAGLARMNIASFLLYTALGAAIWNTILALLGYAAHGQADLIDKYSHELSIAILAIIALIIAIFATKYLLKKRCKK